MNTLELTKKLVSIPSYVGKNCDEKEIGNFVFNYLKQFKWLKVIKQPVKNGRFNVIAFDRYPTQVIMSGHLDTVEPRSDWKTDPFTPTINKDKLYGLGATDMKGSIAAILTSLKEVKETKGWLFLFYIDEEYDFLGMKQFIKEYKTKLKPQYIISADGYNMSLGKGCRGLIEVTCVVKGQTGHASNPSVGKNALLGSTKAIEQLSQELIKTYSNPELGSSTCNLAFMQGGLEQGKDQTGKLVLGREGNNIADIAEFVLDIRPTSLSLNAKKVIALLKSYLKAEGLVLKECRIRHDFGSWNTSSKELKQIEKILGKVTYLNPALFGYIDTQMLWQAFGKATSFTFGAGELSVAHKPNEYILVSQLEKLSKVFTELLHQIGKGGEK